MSNNYEFRALGGYKEKLFNLIMKSDLCDLLIDILMPVSDDERFDKEDNFLGGEFQIDENGISKYINLQGHLFDVPFVYTTISNAANVICVDTNILNNSISTKEMLITVYVMCHKDSLLLNRSTRSKYEKLGYLGRNRLDISVQILGDILNGSKNFGIGRLNPVPRNPTKSYFPNPNDYFGKILEFTCSDFMTDYGSDIK